MRAVALALAVSLPLPVLAHPHVWIDTGVEVLFDAEGRAEALRLTWVYDDFYSMVLVEERGLDADHDGSATAAETAALQGFDMNWDTGFSGDTYLLSGEAPVPLGPPQDWTAKFEGGRLTSPHLRRIDPALPLTQPLRVQAYDPSFYNAYTIALPPTFTPALPQGCKAEVLAAEATAANEQLLAALAEYGADQDVEADFPAVGANFADELVVTCGAE